MIDTREEKVKLYLITNQKSRLRPERDEKRENFSWMNYLQKGQFNSSRNCLSRLKVAHILLVFRWPSTLHCVCTVVCIGLVIIAYPTEGEFLLVKPIPQPFLISLR